MVPIIAAVPAIAELVSTVLRRVLPAEKMTEAEQARVELALLQADWQSVAAQLEVNAQEARSESTFVAGWRPFVGWVCGSALAWNFVVAPLLAFVLRAAGVELPPLPELASDTLMPVLLGMLGLGGMRTYEKLQGANKRR
jgi:hypothetical protein